MYTSPGVPRTVQCLVDAIDDETLGPWIDVRGYPYLTFYVSSAGTTSTGVITFEEMCPAKNWQTTMNPPAFGAASGDYASISTKNASDTSAGKQAAVACTVRAYGWVRARVSTVIGGGGSVSVVLVAF